MTYLSCGSDPDAFGLDPSDFKRCGCCGVLNEVGTLDNDRVCPSCVPLPPPWLLSEDDEFRGAFKTETLAEHAAWECSEKDGFYKEMIGEYRDDHTSVNHIKDVFEWTCSSLLRQPDYKIDETERYALENYKEDKQ